MPASTDPTPWPFVLPLLVFMAITVLEPRFSTDTSADPEMNAPSAAVSAADDDPQVTAWFETLRTRQANRYCLIYAAKVLVVCGLLLGFRRVYHQQVPWSWSVAAIVVGAIGLPLWVGLCELGLETRIWNWLSMGSPGVRSQFNPFVELGGHWQLPVFIGLRFFGLVVMVPLCEELFLRGFLMRYVQSPDWWTVSLNRLTLRALLVAPLYGAVTHPSEVLAAIAWFSLVTWLVTRTGRFWDAVIAHSVTNLLLGLYVCLLGQWHLW